MPDINGSSASIGRLSKKLAELTQNASAPSSTGDARVKLHLVQALEHALQQAPPRELKEDSHDAMTALAQLLERGCCGAVCFKHVCMRKRTQASSLRTACAKSQSTSLHSGGGIVLAQICMSLWQAHCARVNTVFRTLATQL